jgi:hypothetical protein
LRTLCYGVAKNARILGADGPMGAQFANAPQLTTVRAGCKFGCSRADQLGRYVLVAVRAVH